MPTSYLDGPGPLAFAHRGGAAHAPENSWPAFEHAAGLGYRYLETDIQATADGVLVAFHDRTLDRVCGQQGRVCRLSYRDLASVRVQGSETIPKLEDLLGAWPDIKFNIDVKDAPAIRPLAEVLQRANAWDRVCVCSFSATRLRATRRALGQPVCMAASPFGAFVVRVGGPRGPRDVTGPHRFGGAASPERRMGPLAEWLARAGVRCLQVPAYAATASFIRRAHALGLHVHAWTINDRPTMIRLLDLGVDGIMTDETVALREVLTARNQWHPRLASA
jgi:glycerophosphoryl diester phosphodiesterase